MPPDPSFLASYSYLLRTAGSGCASLSLRSTHFTRSAMTAKARDRMEKALETTPGLVESVLGGSGP